MIIAVQFHLSEVVTARYDTQTKLVGYAWRLCVQQLEKQAIVAKRIEYFEHEVLPHDYMPNQYMCRIRFDVGVLE